MFKKVRRKKTKIRTRRKTELV